MVAKAIKEKVSSGDIVRQDRPELSDEAQEQVSELKGKKEALHVRTEGKHFQSWRRCDKEEIKEATQAFKQANQGSV